jgi:LEA14-like dessication related protein
MNARIFILASFALLGCEQLEPFTPKVNFQQFDVQEVDFDRIQADFVFSVDNPNPVDIGLASFSYALGFEQVQLLAGDNENGFELEAIGSSELVLPVDMGWQEAWDTVQATRGKDDIGFFLNGDFGFDTPLGVAEIPYDEEGQFPAVRTPKFSLDNIRVADIDLWTQTANLELDLGIDNDHASNLDFLQFDYDLDFGSDTVASGVIADFASVTGASKQNVVLPIGLDMLALGGTAYQAIVNREKLDLGLNANMDVDTPFGVLPLSVDETGNLQVQ